MFYEGGSVATPTSFSVFDSYDMKILWFKFVHGFTAILKAKKYSKCPKIYQPKLSTQAQKFGILMKKGFILCP